MIRYVLSMLAVLVAVRAVPEVAKGITFSRTVKDGPGADGYLGITPGCSSTDAYGSNGCSLAWGSDVTIMANYSLNADLTAGSTLNLDLKVDKLLPLKTTCPMCGGNCTIDIPVIKQKVSFAMPPCPIAKGSGALNSTKLTLPADPLKSGKVSIDGSISVTDSNQQLVASVQLDLAIE